MQLWANYITFLDSARNGVHSYFLDSLGKAWALNVHSLPESFVRGLPVQGPPVSSAVQGLREVCRAAEPDSNGETVRPVLPRGTYTDGPKLELPGGLVPSLPKWW